MLNIVNILQGKKQLHLAQKTVCVYNLFRILTPFVYIL